MCPPFYLFNGSFRVPEFSFSDPSSSAHKMIGLLHWTIRPIGHIYRIFPAWKIEENSTLLTSSVHGIFLQMVIYTISCDTAVSFEIMDILDIFSYKFQATTIKKFILLRDSF